MGRPKGQLTTFESWAIANCKEGNSFYSDKPDKHLTAIATHHGRKIITERQLVVTTAKSKPVAKYITKVTLK
jgi:hypothetical protein